MPETSAGPDSAGLDREQAVLGSVPTGLFIGGSGGPRPAGATLDVEDPATGEVLVEVADATAEDGQAALGRRGRRAARWAAMPPRERGEILRRAFELITARADDLALLMTLEMGKPLAESRAEITYAAEFLRWFSEEAVRIVGRYAVAPNGATRLLVMKQPVGPCLLITPVELPAGHGHPQDRAGRRRRLHHGGQAREADPAVDARAGRDPAEAGLPDGVLNVITTSTAGQVMEPLIPDPGRASCPSPAPPRSAARLLEQASEKVLRTSMELGGNAPFVVFDDADVDAAVDGAMLAKMRNMGEACTAANRFIVHESVADEFADRLAARMGGAARRAGAPRTASEVGPLIDAAEPGEGRRARRRRRRAGGAGAASAAPRSTGPATSTSPPCSPASRRRPPAERRSSARSPRSSPSPPRTRPSPRPTTPSTGWSPTSSPGT